MEASTSSTSLDDGEAASAPEPPPARARTGKKAVFCLPAQEQWVWLTLGEVVAELVVTTGEVLGSSAAASPAFLPLTSLVKTGDVCEWEPEEENTADDMDEGEEEEEEDDTPPTRRLTVLAPDEGRTKKGSVMVLQSCKTCDLLLGLADKAVIALGQLKVVSTKLNRPRADSSPYSLPSPTTMVLHVRVPVRLCVNRTAPSLCLRQRNTYLPKLLTLCNLLLVAQYNNKKARHDNGTTSSTSTASSPLHQQRQQQQQQQQQQHSEPDAGRGRLAQIFEEASQAPQSNPQQQQQQQPGRRHLLASAAAARQQPNAPLTLLVDDILGLIFSFFDAVDLERSGDTCQYLSAATASIIPGLKARLFPHQSRCLEWMLRRENASWRGRQYPDPAWEELEVTMDGEEGSEEGEGRRSMYVNMMTGEVLLEGGREGGRGVPVPTLTDVRGGFLCDEPGLGKTVTALALILKTGGRLPGPLDDDGQQQEEGGGGGGGRGGGGGTGRFHFRSAGNRRREVDPRALLPTHGTLIISPGPLLQHWREQIERHTEGWALGKGQVFYDDPPGSGGGGGGGGMRPLPSAEELSRYRVVVVTKERLRQEWRTGKPESVLDKWAHRWADGYGYEEDEVGRGEGGGLSPLLGLRWLRIVVDEGHSLGGLQITNEGLMSKGLEGERRWVMTGTPHRHDAADLASLQELLCFLRETSFGVSDAKAWGKLVSSGRSAGGGGEGGELSKRRLVRLLRRIMIRHTKEGIPEIPPPRWNVTRLRMSRLEAATYNTLVSLVQANLITTGMVGGTHAPGVGHPDSHLNPANRRSANTLLMNIRVACCGGGAQIVTLEQKMVVETLKLARGFFLESRRRKGGREGEGEEEGDGAVARVASFLTQMRTNVNTPCDACGTGLIILLVTPCLHLVCCRCMKGRNNVCACCGEVFCVDAFQMLQPGLSVHWDESELDVLPDRVSEGRGGGGGGGGGGGEDGGMAGAGADGLVTASSVFFQAQQQQQQQQQQQNGHGLMTVVEDEEEEEEEEDGGQQQQQQQHLQQQLGNQPLPSPHQATRLFSDSSSSSSSPPDERDGAEERKSDTNPEVSSVSTSPSSSSTTITSITDNSKPSSSSSSSSLSSPHNANNATTHKDTHANADDDGSWRVVSKAWHMITLLRSYLEQQALTPTHPDYRLPLKAVVFSQFRVYLNGLDTALKNEGFRVGKFYERNRLAELARFKSVEEGEGGLQVLLIGKEGSHGLDLSLATHVFLMDQIWDINLQNQVVSRAYRMGAQASVRVEKLVMQDTVEEVMEALASGQLTGPPAVGGLGEGGEEEEEEGEEEDFGLGEGAGNIASASSFSSSSSSLSAMGAGSWGGGGGGGGGGPGKRNGREGRSPTSASGKSAPRRPQTAIKHGIRLTRRKKGNGGGGPGGGPGVAEESKLHILLQSLCLVEVNLLSSPKKAAGLSPLGAAPGWVAAVGAAAGGGGGGGGGEASASAEAVSAASTGEGSGSDKDDETAPPARRVRFM